MAQLLDITKKAVATQTFRVLVPDCNLLYMIPPKRLQSQNIFSSNVLNIYLFGLI